MRSLVDGPLTDGSGKPLGAANKDNKNVTTTPTASGKPTGEAKT
jgi:hypothetical protein